MKKVVSLIAAVMLMVALAGCGSSEPAPEPFTEEAFMEEIATNIDVLDSCVTEVFCTEVDDSTRYMALFENEEDAYSEISKPDKLVEMPDEIVYDELDSQYPGYYTDPALIEYTKVTNFSSINEIRDYIAQYVSDEAVNEALDGSYDVWLNSSFSEVEDGLYLMRGGRGYGAMTYDKDSAAYVEEVDGMHYVTVDVMYFDSFDHTETLEFTASGDGWIITDIQ